MEKDTVLLDVFKYNELRDFKQKIEEGKTMVIVSGYHYHRKEFLTTEKAVEEIAEANRLLQKENEANIFLLSQSVHRSITKDIKKMSYWEFRKWRKALNKNL